MVGVTMLVALVLLGVLLLKFGAIPAHWFGRSRIAVSIEGRARRQADRLRGQPGQ
jgi:hypothetical protein